MKRKNSQDCPHVISDPICPVCTKNFFKNYVIKNDQNLLQNSNPHHFWITPWDLDDLQIQWALETNKKLYQNLKWTQNSDYHQEPALNLPHKPCKDFRKVRYCLACGPVG